MMLPILKGKDLISAIDTYLIDYSIELDLLPRTISGKRETLNRIVNFLNGKELTLDTSREYITDLAKKGWKPSSRKCEIKVIKAFCNFLCKRKYISENWARELEIPKVRRQEFPIITPDIMEQIIIAGTEPSPAGIKGDNSRNRKIKSETRLALRFMLRTALRVTEAIHLKGSDFNFYDEKPTFWVMSKGGNRDLMPIPMDMYDELLTRKDNEYVFNFTIDTANKALQRGAKKKGVNEHLHVHLLRKTIASHLFRTGTSIGVISRLLRHKNISITLQTYAHLKVDDLFSTVNFDSGLVRGVLKPPQLFDELERVVHSCGVTDDKRFAVEIKKSDREFTFKVSLNDY